MNEKLFLESLNEKYDALFARADAIIKKYNPCRVKKVGSHATCIVGERLGQEFKKKYQGEPPPLFVAKRSFCCSDCEKLGKNGCQVQNIGCRAHLCGEASKNLPPEARKELHKVYDLASDLNLTAYRRSKDEILKHVWKEMQEQQEYLSRFDLCIKHK